MDALSLHGIADTVPDNLHLPVDDLLVYFGKLDTVPSHTSCREPVYTLVASVLSYTTGSKLSKSVAVERSRVVISALAVRATTAAHKKNIFLMIV